MLTKDLAQIEMNDVKFNVSFSFKCSKALRELFSLEKFFAIVFNYLLKDFSLIQVNNIHDKITNRHLGKFFTK